jgi:hypothetical protein
MSTHRSNEKIGMMVAATVAAVCAALVFADFVSGNDSQRSGVSMITAAAIERAGASAVVTATPRKNYQPHEAENSGRWATGLPTLSR